MSAIFRNIGGDGTATATFHVIAADGNYLADCSVVLQSTVHNGVTSAECTAYNSDLQNYLDSGGKVTMSATASNL
jgi:hypothetical protein